MCKQDKGPSIYDVTQGVGEGVDEKRGGGGGRGLQSDVTSNMHFSIS